MPLGLQLLSTRLDPDHVEPLPRFTVEEGEPQKIEIVARSTASSKRKNAPVRKKLTARDNNLTILRLCKKYEVPVILGSDAHISFDIARYDHIYELLQETRFPEELILNDKVEAFKKFIGR